MADFVSNLLGHVPVGQSISDRKRKGFCRRFMRLDRDFRALVEANKYPGFEKRVPGPQQDATIGFQMDCYVPYRAPNLQKAIFNKARELDSERTKLVRDGMFDIRHCYEYEEFLDYVDWRGDELSRISQTIEKISPINADFGYYGSENFDEAMYLARHGWPELSKIVPKIEKFPLPSIVAEKDSDWRYDIAGGAVNIGRFLSNAPDCMRSMSPDLKFTRPTKFKTILVTFNMRGQLCAGQLAAAGYHVYEIARAMEMAKIRTDIVFHVAVADMFCSQHSEKAFYSLFVRIKKADEPLELDRVMFGLAHPSFLRRLVLSEMEKNSPEVRRFFGFYKGGFYGNISILSRDKFKEDNDVLYIVASDVLSDRGRAAQNEKIKAIFNECYLRPGR